jgi:predicted alpha/beta-hydrolase family hydrolase
VVEQSAKFEEIQVPLAEPRHGLENISAVLGIPEWWPTGSRVAVVLAHSESSDMNNPMLESLQDQLTRRHFLTLRFNFPFAEAGAGTPPDSMEDLGRAFRTAISVLSRDPTSTPAHIFVGGLGLGARVAAQIATTPMRIEGVFLLGFPLHPEGAPDAVDADQLYRITSPAIFIQGSQDPRCDIDALGKTVRRVGAPIEVRSIRDVDENFAIHGSSLRNDEEVQAEVFEHLYRWIEKHHPKS